MDFKNVVEVASCCRSHLNQDSFLAEWRKMIVEDYLRRCVHDPPFQGSIRNGTKLICSPFVCRFNVLIPSWSSLAYQHSFTRRQCGRDTGY